MIHRTALAGFILCLIVCNVAFAEEEWDFTIGINYRSFEDVDIKSLKFNNPANPNYINGSATDTDGDGIIDTLVYGDGGLQTSPQLFSSPPVAAPLFPNDGSAPASVATFDNIGFGSDSTEYDEGYGIVLGASKGLQDNVDYKWNLDLSLTTVTSQMDYNATPGLAVTSDQFLIPGGSVNIVPVGGNPTTLVNANQILTGASGLGSNTGTLNYDFDLNLYTFGTGVSGNLKKGRFGFSLGVGPTLSLADFDVEVVEVATGTGSYTRKQTDDETDLVFGIYLNVGISIDISDSIAIQVQYRFDEVFDEVDTSLAEVDIDGSSGQLNLIFGF